MAVVIGAYVTLKSYKKFPYKACAYSLAWIIHSVFVGWRKRVGWELGVVGVEGRFPENVLIIH